jgi:hypothetical protein
VKDIKNLRVREHFSEIFLYFFQLKKNIAVGVYCFPPFTGIFAYSVLVVFTRKKYSSVFSGFSHSEKAKTHFPKNSLFQDFLLFSSHMCNSKKKFYYQFWCYCPYSIPINNKNLKFLPRNSKKTTKKLYSVKILQNHLDVQINEINRKSWFFIQTFTPLTSNNLSYQQRHADSELPFEQISFIKNVKYININE